MSRQNKSIKEKIADLQQLIDWFEGDEFALEEALPKYKQAEALAADIKHDLAAFKNEVTVVKKDFSEGE